MQKPVRFSRHALQQMSERGATEEEVLEAIRSGEPVPAKHGRLGYRKNFRSYAVGIGIPHICCIIHRPTPYVVVGSSDLASTA